MGGAADQPTGMRGQGRREFRWAVEADVPPPGIEGRRQLEAEGWLCVGTHPLYTRSHLMERRLPPDDSHPGSPQE